MKFETLINEIRAKAGAKGADDAEERFREVVQEEEARLFRKPIGALDYIARGIGEAGVADALVSAFDDAMAELLEGMSDQNALAEERRLLAAQIGDISTDLFAEHVRDLAVARIMARNEP
jgi:hypothetical protein